MAICLNETMQHQLSHDQAGDKAVMNRENLSFRAEFVLYFMHGKK